MKTLKEEIVVSSCISHPANLQHDLQLLDFELQKLNQQERKAIYMRFWIPCSIAQVATELRVTWDSADSIIETALQKIRQGFDKSTILVEA